MNTKRILSIAVSLYAATAIAQPDTIHTIKLDEVVYSANKFKENKKYIAQPIQRITKKENEWSGSQTTAGLLEQTGNVFMQRSQAGGGSAVLRGFEASRVLMVVDGVRMNNAIYRAGHLQNIITIDNNILENTEVLFGPASTLYGSDALGGVIVFNTKQPKLSKTKKAQVSGGAMARHSTANNEATGHVDFNIGMKKFASLTSVTYSSFGDLRQGSVRNPFYGNFGERNQYVQRINGIDSIVNSSDNNIQKYSGYNQVDVLEKLLFKQSKKISHLLNLQYSNSSNIPRYDRLTDVRSGKLRYAEWYYGPQDRKMASYQFNAEKLPVFFNEIKAGVNYQKIQESRHQRDVGKNALQNRIENVDVLGYNIDMRKMMYDHELTIGTDGQYNKVASTAFTKNITTSEQSSLDTRYPDGGSNMFYGAVYAQHIFKIVDDKLTLNDGIRLNYVSLRSSFNDTSFFPFPFREASQNNTALSGNLGLVYNAAKKWRFSLLGATGFRSPNVDDLAKVFESAGGATIVVPNPNLKPEYTYNLDLGITYLSNDKIKLEGNAFYTWFTNAIVVDNFTLNGLDSINYEGNLTGVVAAQNKTRAYLYGFSTALTAQLIPNVTLYSTINFTYGRYIDLKGAEIPLDHIPPVFGKTSIMYTQKRFTGEVYTIYNGWKKVQDYSTSGEDNLNYATPMGMPAWFTVNLRTGYRISKAIGVQAALENILDYNYRVFASGISAPGRNFVITARCNF